MPIHGRGLWGNEVPPAAPDLAAWKQADDAQLGRTQAGSSQPISPNSGVREMQQKQKPSSSPPPPLATRALTIIPALLGFAVLDITLVALTIANTVAMSGAPDPLSKGVFALNEIILSGADLFVAYLHVSYAHWVVTGRGIHNWADMTDWELRP